MNKHLILAVTLTLLTTGAAGARQTQQLNGVNSNSDSKSESAKRSSEEVLNLLRPAHNKGGVDQELSTADRLERGDGVQVNHEQALKYYADIVFKPMKDDVNKKHVVKDEIAISSLQKHADAGDKEAQNELGYLYQNGSQLKKDVAKAEALYAAAVENGCAAAMNNLAVLYMTDSHDADKFAKVMPLLQKSMSLGNYEAMDNLGFLYERGILVQKDVEYADKLYLQAAAHKVAAAEYNLGYLYQRGLGVKKDLEKSELLYSKAMYSNNVLNKNKDFSTSLGFMSKILPNPDFSKFAAEKNVETTRVSRKVSDISL